MILVSNSNNNINTEMHKQSPKKSTSKFFMRIDPCSSSNDDNNANRDNNEASLQFLVNKKDGTDFKFILSCDNIMKEGIIKLIFPGPQKDGLLYLDIDKTIEESNYQEDPKSAGLPEELVENIIEIPIKLGRELLKICPEPAVQLLEGIDKKYGYGPAKKLLDSYNKNVEKTTPEESPGTSEVKRTDKARCLKKGLRKRKVIKINRANRITRARKLRKTRMVNRKSRLERTRLENEEVNPDLDYLVFIANFIYMFTRFIYSLANSLTIAFIKFSSTTSPPILPDLAKSKKKGKNKPSDKTGTEYNLPDTEEQELIAESKDQRNAAEPKSQMKISKPNGQRKISKPKGQMKISKTKGRRIVTKTKGRRKAAKQRDRRQIAKSKDQKKTADPRGRRKPSELEDQSKTQELEDQSKTQEIKDQSKTQEIKDQSKTPELEDQRKTQELEDQSKTQELEDQSKTPELEDQNKIAELKEQSANDDFRIKKEYRDSISDFKEDDLLVFVYNHKYKSLFYKYHKNALISRYEIEDIFTEDGLEFLEFCKKKKYLENWDKNEFVDQDFIPNMTRYLQQYMIDIGYD